jgi:hypothetical protein
VRTEHRRRNSGSTNHFVTGWKTQQLLQEHSLISTASRPVKWPECLADHKRSLVPTLRMRGAKSPFLTSVFMTWCLIKHRDNFAFCYLTLSVIIRGQDTNLVKV